MVSSLTLSPDEKDEIVKIATRQLVRELITNHGRKVWLTKNEAAGLLDWSPQTVMKHLPHYDTTGNGGSIRFKLSDIDEVLDRQKVTKNQLREDAPLARD